MMERRSGPVELIPNRAETLLRVMPCLPSLTSHHLNWSGFEVHRYSLPPWETPEHSLTQHVIIVHHAAEPMGGEVRVAGSKVRRLLQDGAVSVAPARIPYISAWEKAGDCVTISIDPSTVTEIARADGRIDKFELCPQYAIQDPFIVEVAGILESQVESPNVASRLYAESLAAALAAHLLSKYSNVTLRECGSLTIGKSQLQRGIEFINEHLESDVSLAEIAGAANMSKFHFAKSFRKAMGISPHQYLIKQRMDRARKMLRAADVSIDEIAVRVGYGNKSHFCTQFRKTVGTTPHRYRVGC
jgi:AraC family transcriptional regulator